MCIVACQTDVIKYMLHRPILSGRIGKWAYALIEYDLAYESLKSMKGQIVANFVVEHRIDNEHDIDVNLVSLVPWRLYFDGSTRSNGQGVGVVYVSPHGIVFEASFRLEYFCTNNQVEYEALLFGLELLVPVGATHIEAFGDSLLVVQQISKVFQCFDESLNVYLDKCLDIISTLDYFSIAHISREDNWNANELAQQASGYHVDRGVFHVSNELMLAFANTGKDKTKPIISATNEGSSACGDKDWRRPIVEDLQDPSKRADRSVRWMAFKYVLMDNDLYCRTVDGILLKCLNEDQSRVSMGEVHEGICGTHQSAHKMK
jgi:ribonuclease HI